MHGTPNRHFEDLYEPWSWEKSQDMRIAHVTENGSWLSSCA